MLPRKTGSTRLAVLVCLLLAALLLSAGCGGGSASVSDQLALDKSTTAKPPKPPPEPPEPADPAIAYSISGSELMVMDADGANQTSVGAPYGARQPSWSPDGSKLAFAIAGSDFTICTINVDGSDLAEVTQGMWLPGSPAWSPVPVVIEEFGPAPMDVLAYRDTYGVTADEVQGEIYLVPADGSRQPVKLTDTRYVSEDHPTWSFDGTKLAYRWSEYDTGELIGRGILVYDFATGEATEIAGEGPLSGVGVQWLSWAKTQDKIALSALTSEPQGPGATGYEIWVINLVDPANPTQLTNDPTLVFRSPSWSPDDSEIVYEVGNGETKPSGSYDEIWKMNADGTSKVRLAKPLRKNQNPNGPDWRRNP